MKYAICSAIVLIGLVAPAMAGAEPAHPIYIPTGESAEVLIIDGDSHEAVGRIGGLPAAHGLAVTPDGALLIVGSYDERAPGTEVPEKPEGMAAADHAAHHKAGSEKAPAGAVSTVSIVDLKSRSVTRRIDVPGAVHHVAASPDGRVAVVTHPNAGAISVIDLSEMALVETVPTGELPNYAAFSPDGGTLYVTNAGESDMAVLDTVDWTVTGRIPLGRSPEHLAVSPDGERIYVNNVDDGTVSVVDPAAGRVVDTLSFGEALHGIDLSPDGGTLYVAVRGADEVVAVELADGARRSVALPPAPYHLSVLGGDEVYVSSAEEPVVRVLDAASLETLAEIPLTGIGHQFAEPAAW